VLPAFVRRSDSAPVRDALFAALTEILLRYQELSGYAAAQCDIARATGPYLDGLCEDRGIFRQLGERDDALRARALTTPDLVTPAAIVAAANAILARHTPIQAQYAESILDRWYVQNGSARWHSFVGANPQYRVRLYPEDASANGGFVRPNSRIGGAWAFADRVGRYFVLRVPVLTGLGAAHGFVLAQPWPNSQASPGAFVADGTNQGGTEAKGRIGWWVYRDATSALSVYQAIANAVGRIRAHSVRWALYADPHLTR
jgi:hypothetical protein